jgi:predicted ribosome quality control (RQC) complex YloA/Tae2 family protein
LTWPSGTPSQVDSLNALCAAAIASGEEAALAPRLAAVRKRLQALIDRCDRETAALHRAQAEAQEADRLRIAGESIYAYLRDIPERADHFVTPEGARIALDPSMDAKQNAATYFRRFKKARRGLPNIAQRLRVLETNRSFWESLAWEAERIHSHGGEDAEVVLEEIETAAGVRRKAAQPRRRPQRVERTVPLSGGAIAYIGRSPRDNERLTFSVAGPNDLWFHTRGMPGAHVVLKLSGATQPTEKQIVEAASLAAGHSRAANAAKVEVDYTQRKHVRRQGGGRPGLVWYTDFHTVLVAPRKL